MDGKYSSIVIQILSKSRLTALQLGNNYVGIEHVFLAIIDVNKGKAIELLHTLGLDIGILKKYMLKALNVEDSSYYEDKNPFFEKDDEHKKMSLPLTNQLEQVLRRTYLFAQEYKSSEIKTEHLLLSILKDEKNNCSQLLERFKVRYETVKELFENYLGKEEQDSRGFKKIFYSL